MKKRTLLFAAAIALATTTHAQQYLQFGVHGGFGTTWMINSNVSDQGANLDPEISFAGMGGVHVMAAFTKSLGLQLEVNTATIKQKYKGEDGPETYDGMDRATYLEVPVLVMLKSSGFYFEIGPKFSFLSNAKSEYNSNIPAFSFSDRNVKAGFNNTLISGVIGLGGEFPLTKSKNLLLNAGLRFSYGFSDATKEYSEPNLQVAVLDEQIGIATSYAHLDQNGDYSYKPTHIATGHIMLGLSYRLAFNKKS